MSSRCDFHGTIPATSRTECDVDLLQLLSAASVTLIASVVYRPIEDAAIDTQ
jgi:hypothetical protein